MWSNFHTHAHYCDGNGSMIEYLETCRNEGVRHIGFSSHAPLPFPCKWSMKAEALPRYLEEIRSAKKDFPDVEVYTALEVDYIPGVIAPSDFANHLDYTVGSIHFVKSFGDHHWEIDNTQDVFDEGLAKIFDNNIQAALSAYYRLTREMLEVSPPDVLGHLDKIKINSLDTYFSEDEAWYQSEIEKTLDVIAKTNTTVEVNTRGLYKKKSATTYPSPWILERLRDMRVPVTICSDAHHPRELIREFKPVRDLLIDVGFREVNVLIKGRWTPVPLTEYGAVG